MAKAQPLSEAAEQAPIRGLVGLRASRAAPQARVIAGLAAASLAVSVGCGATLDSDRVGLRAPVFALANLDDGKPYGTPDLRGTPTVVVFWAPGCDPCASELQLLQQSWERHRHQGLAVLGVQVGLLAEPAAPEFPETNGITFPSVRDSSGVVAGSFGVTGIPEAYFIDANWRIQAVDRGEEIGADRRRGLALWSAIPPDLLERRITELLVPPSPSPTSAA